MRPAILAIDFEASCLPRHGLSFPIEVGVADECGGVRSSLIRPDTTWRDWTWTAEAEALHGLTRERLYDEGRPAAVVAAELTEILQGRLVIADSYLDDDWMRTLMAAAGRPPPTRIVHVDALADRLDLTFEEVVGCVAAADAHGFRRHRAGDDAQWLAALLSAMKAVRPARVHGCAATASASFPWRAAGDQLRLAG